MRPASRPLLLLAVLLALLVPLAQAHCLWMIPSASAAACDMKADHSCCARPQAPAPASQAPAECPCLGLPSGTLPAVGVVPIAPMGADLGVVETASDPIADAPASAAAAPVLDTGPPPAGRPPGAPGLRAPPEIL